MQGQQGEEEVTEDERTLKEDERTLKHIIDQMLLLYNLTKSSDIKRAIRVGTYAMNKELNGEKK
jgi:hypothetical protein